MLKHNMSQWEHGYAKNYFYEVFWVNFKYKKSDLSCVQLQINNTGTRKPLK